MLTQDILKTQLGTLQAAMEGDTMQPFCDHAERWFADEIGRPLFAYLNGLTATVDRLELTDDRELLRLAHSCLAWQAYSLAFPHQKFRVGELGMMKASPQNAIAVTKWEYVDSRDANLSMLDLSLEYFFRELELRQPAAWTASDAYKVRNKHFIRSAAELGALLPIAGRNYRFFQKLINHIEDVEDDAIRDALTPGVYSRLKVAWQNPLAELSGAEADLISLVQRATAYLAVYEAYPYLPLSVNQEGIAEKRSKDGTSEDVAPDANLRGQMRQKLYSDGQKRLGRIRTFLDETATATLFSDYYLKYTAPTATPVLPDDFTDKPHVIL